MQTRGVIAAENHPLSSAPPDIRGLLERSVQHLPRIVEIGLRTPMRSFRGRPLMTLIDPSRVSPAALDQLARAAGPALATSSHWHRRMFGGSSHTPPSPTLAIHC